MNDGSGAPMDLAGLAFLVGKKSRYAMMQDAKREYAARQLERMQDRPEMLQNFLGRSTPSTTSMLPQGPQVRGGGGGGGWHGSMGLPGGNIGMFASPAFAAPMDRMSEEERKLGLASQQEALRGQRNANDEALLTALQARDQKMAGRQSLLQEIVRIGREITEGSKHPGFERTDTATRLLNQKDQLEALYYGRPANPLPENRAAAVPDAEGKTQKTPGGGAAPGSSKQYADLMKAANEKRKIASELLRDSLNSDNQARGEALMKEATEMEQNAKDLQAAGAAPQGSQKDLILMTLPTGKQIITDNPQAQLLQAMKELQGMGPAPGMSQMDPEALAEERLRETDMGQQLMTPAHMPTNMVPQGSAPIDVSDPHNQQVMADQQQRLMMAAHKKTQPVGSPGIAENIGRAIFEFGKSPMIPLQHLGRRMKEDYQKGREAKKKEDEAKKQKKAKKGEKE